MKRILFGLTAAVALALFAVPAMAHEVIIKRDDHPVREVEVRKEVIIKHEEHRDFRPEHRDHDKVVIIHKR